MSSHIVKLCLHVCVVTSAISSGLQTLWWAFLFQVIAQHHTDHMHIAYQAGELLALTLPIWNTCPCSVSFQLLFWCFSALFRFFSISLCHCAPCLMSSSFLSLSSFFSLSSWSQYLWPQIQDLVICFNSLSSLPKPPVQSSLYFSITSYIFQIQHEVPLKHLYISQPKLHFYALKDESSFKLLAHILILMVLKFHS